MAITNSQLSSVSKTVVFASTGENAVTCIIFCNTSLTTDATVSVWLVPATVPAAAATQIINEISIPAGETFSIDTERFILEDSDSIQAQSSQNLIVTATVSYVSTGQ
jgi:hypothetical protein